jgi:branched-chain amino acid transport system substrate-binding protein
LETFGAALQAAAQQAVPAGEIKLATLACVETQVCEDGDRLWASEAQALGFQPVYRSRPSLTQPDFTAECLAARNAGAQVVMAGLDTASISRLAASCARQGYKPIYATLSALIADRMKSDPNLDGMIGSSNVFPYFQSGTPASDEFQQTMRAYGSHVEPGAAPATGWVSAKLFERAAARLPEPPTAEAVLTGLWTLRGDPLGGLTQPLTFVQDQPAKRLRCWFTLRIRNRAWASPDGFQQHCRQ